MNAEEIENKLNELRLKWKKGEGDTKILTIQAKLLEFAKEKLVMEGGEKKE